MEPGASDETRAVIWRLCLGWCGFLFAIYAVATFAMSASMLAETIAAERRHKARLDPNAVEAGRTEADDHAPRLDRAAKSLEVTAGIYVDRIFDVSARNTRWMADFYIWFRWRGDDTSPGDSIQLVDGAIITKTLESRNDDGDAHYALYRIKGEITKFFNVSRFPRDDHVLTIRLEDSSQQSYDLTYLPDREGSGVSSRVEIPGYRIRRADLVEKKHSYKTRRGDLRLPEGHKATYSQLVHGIWIERAGWGLYLKMFIGIFASVAIALLAFFINPAHTGPKFEVGIGAFFAAIASTYIVTRQLPLSDTFGLTELVTFVSLMTILLTLLTSAISVWVYGQLGEATLSRRLDRLAQVIIGAGYVTLNLVVALAASV